MEAALNADDRRVCEINYSYLSVSKSKTVEEYVLHRWITVKNLVDEEMRGGGGCKWAEIGKQMRKKMHRTRQNNSGGVSECLYALEKQSMGTARVWTRYLASSVRMNTRNDQSKGHSRETGDESEKKKGGKVMGVISAGKWGVYSTKVFRSCLCWLRLLSLSASSPPAKKRLLRAPNPNPIPISVLDSS